MKSKSTEDMENFPIRMTQDDWKKSYEGETPPHWAEDFEPSPLAGRLLNLLPEESGNQILEIGAGNGRDSIFFAKKGNQVTGIDLAPGAIKLAEENAKKNGVADKINLSVAKAESLPFANEHFDAVYSISVLHSTVLPESMAEISRVLKPQGKALIYLYEMNESGGKKYWFWKEGQIETMCKENNLKIDYKENFFDDRHAGEVTKVLIFEIHKEENAQ